MLIQRWLPGPRFAIPISYFSWSVVRFCDSSTAVRGGRRGAGDSTVVPLKEGPQCAHKSGGKPAFLTVVSKPDFQNQSAHHYQHQSGRRACPRSFCLGAKPGEGCVLLPIWLDAGCGGKVTRD